MPTQEEKGLVLTAQQLQDLIATAVTAAVSEAKKPFISEQAQKQMEQDQQTRKETAENILRGIEQKKHMQRMCTHTRREDGKTRAVYVENGTFMICQGCQAIIRPGTAPVGDRGTDIYDDQLFYRLFQMAQPVSFGS